MTTPARFSAVLFDLDGTLVDSLQDIAASMNRVLAHNQLPTHAPDAYKHFVGDGMETLVRRVLPGDRVDEDDLRARILQQMKRDYSDRWYDASAPYPGIRELLSDLQTRPLRLGVLSNKPDEFTTVMVEHFFPDTPWDTVRGALPGVPVKPAPDAVLLIAAEWGLAPSQILYVGDTCTDILTARNAGMPSVGVTWGFRDRAELETHGANWIIDEAHSLLTLLSVRNCGEKIQRKNQKQATTPA